jgi:hypothetical protein
MRDPGLKAALMNAQPAASDGSVLRISSPTPALLNDKRRLQIGAAVKHVTGLEIRVDVEEEMAAHHTGESFPHADPDIAPPVQEPVAVDEPESYSEFDLVDADEHDRQQAEAVTAGARSMPASRAAGESVPASATDSGATADPAPAPLDRLDLFQTTFNATEVSDT